MNTRGAGNIEFMYTSSSEAGQGLRRQGINSLRSPLDVTDATLWCQKLYCCFIIKTDIYRLNIAY